MGDTSLVSRFIHARLATVHVQLPHNFSHGQEVDNENDGRLMARTDNQTARPESLVNVRAQLTVRLDHLTFEALFFL